jgi:predicted phosphohydrolase
MRVVCISDTHFMHGEITSLPVGDVLIHAGDVCAYGLMEEVVRTMHWLARQPHRHKVLIAGNHDWPFELSGDAVRALVPPGVTYLQDSGVTIEGVRVWGSPWQPEFLGWAFNLPRGDALAAVWAQIPADTNVLITHGPPSGILDRVARGPQGCEDLTRRVSELPQLGLHVFGHIHEGYGHETQDGVLYVNASMQGELGGALNPPIVVDLPTPVRRGWANV